jgi:hypothetical protein
VVGEQGRGTFERCDLFHHPEGWSAFGVETGGDPKVVNCQIHDNKGCGVWVTEQGSGSFEGCDLFGHDDSPALAVTKGGDPKVVNCQIHDNQCYGVWVKERGRGTFEGCHFYRNGDGAWKIGWWCGAQRKNNRDDG